MTAHPRQAGAEFLVGMDTNGSGAPSTYRGANGPPLSREEQ